MEPSILNSVKKIVGVGVGDTSFDQDIITFINSAFSTLHQIGIGPLAGFFIEDADDEWADFIDQDDPNASLVRTYVCMRARMGFDPPTTSYLIGALNEQIKEFEYRLSINREDVEWVDPNPDPELTVDEFGDPIVVDGGGAGD
jgi:hypothetical protein